MDSAKRKAQQRKRRKEGFQELRALVYMPKFVAWLVWDGRLKEEDARNPAAIRRALEDFLREQYALMAEEPSATEFNFQFARGSFGAEFTALRDRPKEVVGLIEREGQCEWRDPPTRYLITQRTALLRKAVPPYTSPYESADAPPGAPMFYDENFLPEEPPPDDYDPEIDVEEASAELSDDALADCFNVDGYEEG